MPCLKVTRVVREAAPTRRGVSRHRAVSLKLISTRRFLIHALTWDDIVCIAIDARRTRQSRASGLLLLVANALHNTSMDISTQ